MFKANIDIPIKKNKINFLKLFLPEKNKMQTIIPNNIIDVINPPVLAPKYVDNTSIFIIKIDNPISLFMNTLFIDSVILKKLNMEVTNKIPIIPLFIP